MGFKKLILAAAAVLAISFAANADIHPNALGLRFGSGSLSGAELNYQRGMGAKNRLELGGSWSTSSSSGVYTRYSTNYFGLIGAYQWHFGIAPGFNWYVGPGAGIGMWMWSYNYGGTRYSDSGFYVDIGGQIGIEYDLNNHNVPILLSLDVRPMFGLIESAGFGWAAGFGVRYTF